MKPKKMSLWFVALLLLTWISPAIARGGKGGYGNAEGFFTAFFSFIALVIFFWIWKNYPDTVLNFVCWLFVLGVIFMVFT